MFRFFSFLFFFLLQFFGVFGGALWCVEPPPLGNHGSRSERTDSRELSRAGAARVDSASDEREIRELARRYFLWPRNVTVREQEEAEEAQEAEAEKPRWRERGSEAEAEAEAEAEKLRHKKRLKIKAHRHTHSHKERRTSTAAARRAFLHLRWELRK